MFDLERGILLNDKNKTHDPRMWAMDPHSAEAMRRWRKAFHPKAGSNDLVFTLDGEPLNPDRLAETFRRHLEMAGIKRSELFLHTENRLRIRAHDLRATFVTLSLAGGKTERWVMCRTGHTSSEMISTYERAVRTAEEAKMTRLHPMVAAIPELAALPATPGYVPEIAEPDASGSAATGEDSGTDGARSSPVAA